MNKSDFREKHPEIYQAAVEEGRLAGIAEGMEQGKAAGILEGKSAGAAEERARIKAIEEMAVQGQEELVAKLKWDGSISREAAAMKILAAEKARQTEMAAALATSGPAPVPDPPDPGKPAEDTYEAAVERLIAEGKTMGQAIKQVAQDRPDLHKAYIARINKRAE